MASERPVSRRGMLRFATGASAAALLAACGGSGPPKAPAIGGAGGSTPTSSGAATSAPAATAANTSAGASATTASAVSSASAATSAPAATTASSAAGSKVFTMADKTWTDVGMRDATGLYNAARPSAPQVTVEDTPDGWDTKVLAQIRDKNLRWSGHGYIAFFDTYKQIKAGLATPIDDYLKASKTPWAANQKSVYFTPRVYDSLTFEGKQYFIPMKANVHLTAYRLDYVQAAGYDSLPKTWDEIDKMLPKMKAALAKDQVTPFGIQDDLFRCICTTFTTFVDNPFDEQGVLKFDSPEWIDMMTMFTKWTTSGLARYDSTTDSTDAWQKGKIGMSLGSHSAVRLGRQVWGPDKVKGAIPPQANASKPPRTWSHIDCGIVFPGAPSPQDATDWLLNVLGPEGAPAEKWWNGVVTFSGSPVHQSMIDKVLKGKPEYQEVFDVLNILPNSQIATINNARYYAILQAKMPPYLTQMFKGTLTVKEAMAKTRADFNDEVAKQKA